MDYELTLILDPDLTTDTQKKLITKIKKLVEDPPVGGKGKVEKTDDWGKKDFAYPIAKKSFGYYTLLAFSSSGEAVVTIDKKLKLEEGILRYLLIKMEARHGTKITK